MINLSLGKAMRTRRSSRESGTGLFQLLAGGFSFFFLSFRNQALDEEFECALGLFVSLESAIIMGGAPEEVFGNRQLMVGKQEVATLAGKRAGDSFRVNQGLESSQGHPPGSEGGGVILLRLVELGAIGSNGRQAGRVLCGGENFFGFSKGFFCLGGNPPGPFPEGKIL